MITLPPSIQNLSLTFDSRSESVEMVASSNNKRSSLTISENKQKEATGKSIEVSRAAGDGDGRQKRMETFDSPSDNPTENLGSKRVSQRNDVLPKYCDKVNK